MSKALHGTLTGEPQRKHFSDAATANTTIAKNTRKGCRETATK